MTVQVQLSQITNDKSIMSIFIKERPVFWEAHSVFTDVMNPATGEKFVRKDIKAQSLLRTLLDKYCNVSDKTPMEEGMRKLKQALGNDYNSALAAVGLTEQIAQKMANQEYAQQKQPTL